MRWVGGGEPGGQNPTTECLPPGPLVAGLVAVRRVLSQEPALEEP